MAGNAGRLQVYPRAGLPQNPVRTLGVTADRRKVGTNACPRGRVCMTHFYFHIRKRRSLLEHPEGVRLRCENEAVEEARQSALSLLAERVRSGLPIESWVIEVCDASGRVVSEVNFHDVMRSVIVEKNGDGQA